MTIIAKGTEVNGSVDVEGNIRIDGTVNGDVKATDGVEVGKSGRIVGSSIESKTAIINGYVESQLTVSQHVLLGSKSTFVGDLKTKSLVIEEGAVFHGNSAMSDEPAGSDQANRADQADRVDGGDAAASGTSGTGGSQYPYGR
ncbi:MAG: polymer-forming cytoskeletal protein [Gemmatimonadetes bacterium]|nr:polymer-forming cytoskeletal protein [Gemmatimonadota bacterium]